MHAEDLSKPAHRHLNPYEKPPEKLRAIFKSLKGPFNQAKADSECLVDPKKATLPMVGRVPRDILRDALNTFAASQKVQPISELEAHGHAYSVEEIPGRSFPSSLQVYQNVVFSAFHYVSNTTQVF